MDPKWKQLTILIIILLVNRSLCQTRESTEADFLNWRTSALMEQYKENSDILEFRFYSLSWQDHEHFVANYFVDSISVPGDSLRFLQRIHYDNYLRLLPHLKPDDRSYVIEQLELSPVLKSREEICGNGSKRKIFFFSNPLFTRDFSVAFIVEEHRWEHDGSWFQYVDSYVRDGETWELLIRLRSALASHGGGPKR